MDNTINFKGAFLLKQPTAAVKRGILPKIGKHNQIFNDFINKGDMLYITRKGCDKDVAEYLTHHRTKFEYYTDLSTKSGFDIEKPAEAKSILENYKGTIITKIYELKNMFKLKTVNLGFSTKKRDNTLNQAISALKLDMSDKIIKRRNGFNEIYTRDGVLVASISEPGQYGFRYARIEPKNPKDPSDEVRRYAVRGGEIQFTYANNPDEDLANGSTAFLKNYLKAVKYNRQFIHT